MILCLMMPVCGVIGILLTQPCIVFVQPVVSGPYFPPFWCAEDAIGVIAILSNTIQFLRVHPVFAYVLLYMIKEKKL